MNTATKKACATLALALPCLLFPTSCNDEWTEEQYQKSVSFVKSAGVEITKVYLKYSAAGGMVPYKIPMVISGSTGNDRDVTVTVDVDIDTLKDVNFESFRYQENLYYHLLDEDYYEFPNGKQITIPAGEDVGLLDINFKLANLDMVYKYLLPLKIVNATGYPPSTRRGFKSSLMRIIPFNDYSGEYQPTGEGKLIFLVDKSGQWVEATEAEGGVSSENSAYDEYREARVVDDSTVFFYAGKIQELDANRALYKIRMKFHADSTLTLEADSAQQINFIAHDSCRYRIEVTTDPTMPYLERRYVIVSLGYDFFDLSNPEDKIRYRVKGLNMRMSRSRNTLIPEEDQQFIFE
jgi:hypothetical protein